VTRLRAETPVRRTSPLAVGHFGVQARVTDALSSKS
jgi:hypothetical protein